MLEFSDKNLVLGPNTAETNGITLAEVRNLINSNIGKTISLGFDGILENNVLTFSPPTDTDMYNIKENYEYELDLHFQATTLSDDTIEVELENDGELIQFWTINHPDCTTSLTWGEFKKLAIYDDTNGYRWLFKAQCRITENAIKCFLIYPTLIKDN